MGHVRMEGGADIGIGNCVNPYPQSEEFVCVR